MGYYSGSAAICNVSIYLELSVAICFPHMLTLSDGLS